MGEAFKQILEFLRQKVSIWISVALASIIFLLLPTGIAKQVGIQQLRENFGGYVACTLIVTLSLITVHLIERTLHANSKKKRLAQEKEDALEAEVHEIAKQRSLDQQRVNTLHRLSVAEKQILCGYILTGEKIQYLAIQDGNVAGLCNNGILYQSSQLGNLHGRGFAFNIQDWAWDYLQRNTHLIGEGVPKDPHGRIILYQNPHKIFDL